MPQPSANPPPGFDDLTVDERIDYVGALWDRIAADPESVPVPEWHREILEERLEKGTLTVLLPSGTYTVEATHWCYGSDRRTLSVHDSPVELDLRLRK